MNDEQPLFSAAHSRKRYVGIRWIDSIISSVVVFFKRPRFSEQNLSEWSGIIIDEAGNVDEEIYEGLQKKS